MSKESQKKREEAPSSLPLFFHAPAPLELKRHRKAGILPTQDLSFAAATNSIPLNAIEFTEAAKHYPIVFIQGDVPMPVAVVGLEQQNYFLDKQGRWKEGAYLPAYVRKYPFVFMEIPDQQQFLLCIDEEAPQYKEKATGADVLAFYDGEQPSELTKNALEFCSAFHNHYQITRQMAEALRDNDLLSPTQSDAKLFNGREIHLAGFQVVDEKKLNELPEAKFLEFRKQGWLPFLYFALMSSTNWGKLVDMAASQERKQSPNKLN